MPEKIILVFRHRGMDQKMAVGLMEKLNKEPREDRFTIKAPLVPKSDRGYEKTTEELQNAIKPYVMEAEKVALCLVESNLGKGGMTTANTESLALLAETFPQAKFILASGTPLSLITARESLSTHNIQSQDIVMLSSGGKILSHVDSLNEAVYKEEKLPDILEQFFPKSAPESNSSPDITNV